MSYITPKVISQNKISDPHKLTPNDYQLYNKFYILTKPHFYDLVGKFKPTIINYIPREMKYKNTILPYNGKYLLIKENWRENEELNNVTDFFTEVVRIQCKFKNNISPFDYWVKNYDELIRGSTDQSGILNIQKLRDLMYKNIKFCNNFRISVALTIYKLFNANKILDPSAGWGDRLIAAIGHRATNYIGVDPNEKLHQHYNDIIKFLVDEDKRQNYMVINDGFEYANIPKKDYDLVFTSPPFFDLEEYSTSKKDSMVAYPTADQWYNNFLLVMLRKAYSNLIMGGHIVLYIAESTNTHYIGKMVSFMDKLMKSTGSIYYFYEGAYVPRQMYVWKKVNYLPQVSN